MSEAQIITLADRRPLIRLAAESEAAARTEALLDRVAANAAQVRTWETTPRGRFWNAVQRLVSLGYVGHGVRLLGAYEEGFKRLDAEPVTAFTGAAFGVLASIPQADPLAHRQARAAVAALTEIAGLIEPSYPTQNGAA